MALPARYAPAEAIAGHHKPAIRKIDEFVASCGKERFLAALCLTSHTDDRLDTLLGLLEDPSYRGRTVGEIALATGFRAGELIKIIKESALLIGQAEALQVYGESLGAIARDMVARAQNHYEPCAACEGVGKITPDPTKEKPNPEPEICKPCRGKGQILVQADPARQDKILEIAKLVPKGGGVNVGVGVNVTKEGGGASVASMGALFSQLVAATDRIVHPDRSPIRDRAPVTTEPSIVDGVVLPSPSASPAEDEPRAGS